MTINNDPRDNDVTAINRFDWKKKYHFIKEFQDDPVKEGTVIKYKLYNMEENTLLVELDNYYISLERHREIFKKVGFKSLKAVDLMLSPEIDTKFSGYWKDLMDASPVCALVAMK